MCFHDITMNKWLKICKEKITEYQVSCSIIKYSHSMEHEEWADVSKLRESCEDLCFSYFGFEIR